LREIPESSSDRGHDWPPLGPSAFVAEKPAGRANAGRFACFIFDEYPLGMVKEHVFHSGRDGLFGLGDFFKALAEC